jgi:hypothetical protein
MSFQRMTADTAETVAGVVRLLVRQTLDSARMLTPDVERMAAGVLSADGLPRYGWTDDKPDPAIYTVMLLRAVADRQQWRAQYDRAKQAAPEVVDNHSATGAEAPYSATVHGSASPDDPAETRAQERQSRVSASTSAGHERSECPRRPDRRPHSAHRGRPTPQPPTDATVRR